MKMKNRTKIMFAEELTEMLKTTSIEKIRVVDLAQRCGATPQAFYYHFKDKYELVAWMFLQDFAEIFGDQQPEYSAQKLQAIMDQMEGHRIFYKKAFSENSQNSILEYIHDFDMRMAIAALKRATGSGAISVEQLLTIKYHSYGVMGIFKEWICSDDPMPTSQLAEFMFNKTPEYLQNAFQQYPYSTKSILENSK